jgi:hypothetical protein
MPREAAYLAFLSDAYCNTPRSKVHDEGPSLARRPLCDYPVKSYARRCIITASV